MKTPRNLIVLRAGNASLHRAWIAGVPDFDLFISYYGDTPGRFQDDGDFYEQRAGPKWSCIAELLEARKELLDDYDAFWFPDDDLSVDTDTLNRMFAFFHAFELSLAQPALTRNSYYTWKTLLQDPGCHLRFVGFVEVMAPIFSGAALKVCRATFSESRSGWGLDWVWPTLCRKNGLQGVAVIDATPVWHTRPMGGGELYAKNRELDPRGDAVRVIRQYGLQEVRAVAKYSIERRVCDVRLPWRQRFVFWLKKLNGRRKHLHAK